MLDHYNHLMNDHKLMKNRLSHTQIREAESAIVRAEKSLDMIAEDIEVLHSLLDT
jgi:hypothetical protein